MLHIYQFGTVWKSSFHLDIVNHFSNVYYHTTTFGKWNSNLNELSQTLPSLANSCVLAPMKAIILDDLFSHHRLFAFQLIHRLQRALIFKFLLLLILLFYKFFIYPLAYSFFTPRSRPKSALCKSF